MHSTKQRLVDEGLRMMLRQGYNSLGVQALLDAANVPKGSFYHHFADKEDFAHQVIDAYTSGVHAALDACVTDISMPPLERICAFFRQVERQYREEGYLGCLIGGLGQELSGVNDTFRLQIEQCFDSIARRLQTCLDAAQAEGSISRSVDTAQMASLLVDCWEGAALRSRLTRSRAPLDAMLDYYLSSIAIEDPENPGV